MQSLKPRLREGFTFSPHTLPFLQCPAWVSLLILLMISLSFLPCTFPCHFALLSFPSTVPVVLCHLKNVWCSHHCPFSFSIIFPFYSVFFLILSPSPSFLSEFSAAALPFLSDIPWDSFSSPKELPKDIPAINLLYFSSFTSPTQNHESIHFLKPQIT